MTLIASVEGQTVYLIRIRHTPLERVSLSIRAGINSLLYRLAMDRLYMGIYVCMFERAPYVTQFLARVYIQN